MWSLCLVRFLLSGSKDASMPMAKQVPSSSVSSLERSHPEVIPLRQKKKSKPIRIRFRTRIKAQYQLIWWKTWNSSQTWTKSYNPQEASGSPRKTTSLKNNNLKIHICLPKHNQRISNLNTNHSQHSNNLNLRLFNQFHLFSHHSSSNKLGASQDSKILCTTKNNPVQKHQNTTVLFKTLRSFWCRPVKSWNVFI